MLEEHYINGVSIFEQWNWKRECFIQNCRYCGNITIATHIMCCPVCGSGNIVVVPFRDHPSFSTSWLVCHGFPYLEERLGYE